MNFTMSDSGPKKKVYVDTNPFGIMALDERQQEACTMNDVSNNSLSESTDTRINSNMPTVETLDMPITTFNQPSLSPNLLNQHSLTQSNNLTLPSMPNHRPRKLSNTLDPGISSSRKASYSGHVRPELLVNTARGPISSAPNIPTNSRPPIISSSSSSSSSSHVHVQAQQTSSNISSPTISSTPKPQVFDNGSYTFQIPDIVRDSFARAQLDTKHSLSPTVENISPTNSLNDLIDEYSISHTPDTDIHINNHELTTPLEMQSQNSSAHTFVPQSTPQPLSQSFSQHSSSCVPYRVLPSQSELYPVPISDPPSLPPSAPLSAPPSIPPSVPPSVPPLVPPSVHSSVSTSALPSVTSSVPSSGPSSVPPSRPPSVPSSPYLRRSSDNYHVSRSSSQTSPIVNTSTFNGNYSTSFVLSPKRPHDNYKQNYSTPTITMDANLPPPLPPKPPKMLSRLDIPASQLLESLSRRRSSVSSLAASVNSTIHDQTINDSVVEEGDESQEIECEQLVPMDPPSNSYDIPVGVNVGDRLNRLRQEQQHRIQEELLRQAGSVESELTSSDSIPEYVPISADDYGNNFDNESHLTLTTPTTTNSNVSMESNQSSQSLHTTTTSVDNVTSTQESLSLVHEITEEEFLASLPAPPDYTNKASPGEISVPNRMAIDPITVNDNPPKEDPPEYTEVSAELAPLILRPQFSQTGGNRRSSRGSRSGSNTNSSSNFSTNTSSRTHTRPSIYPTSRHSNRTHELNAPPLLPNRPPALPGNRHAASESYNRSPRQPSRVVRSLIPLEIQESNLPVGGSTIYDGSRRSSNSSVYRQGSSTSVNSRTRR